jgi:hypothetical protein
MLAQNFKAATDLGITEKELSALIAVLGRLERGELVETHKFSPTVPNGFSMSIVSTATECGTVGCIKGWCQMDSGVFMKSFAATGELYDLFMYDDERRHGVTVEQAASGLRNYLTTGKANWDEVLS